jgi:hypothetical protein
MTSILRGTMQSLAKADARLIRDVEAITGGKVRGTRGRTAAGQATRDAAKTGSVSRTLGTGLRALAQSDARMIREMGKMAGSAKPRIKGAAKGRKALPKARKKAS